MPGDPRTDRLTDAETSPLNAEELSRALDELEAENREVRKEREKIFRALIEEHRKREREQHFLSDVSVILAASLDYDAVLSSIARVCIPYLADCAVVDIIQPDQFICRQLGPVGMS